MQLLHPSPRTTPPAAPARHDEPLIQTSQSGEATADVRAARPTSIGMLLTNHVLQDGELVLLVLKPSVWFVLISSSWTIGLVLIGLLSALVFDEEVPGRASTWVELAVFLLAGRVMWAVLHWMGRLYILTDMRILRLSGVFNVNIFDCPLRKVARTRVLRTMRERLMRLGSIEVTPCDTECEAGAWNTVAKPDVVNEQINAAINRAKSGRGNPVRMG